VWLGADSDAAKLKGKLVKISRAKPGATVQTVVVNTYKRLAEAPSAVITATLEDALCVEERPNVPGTTTERPNWSLALPERLEELEKNPTVQEVGRVLNRHRTIA
jgi:4-alpha-glucanotransferase